MGNYGGPAEDRRRGTGLPAAQARVVGRRQRRREADIVSLGMETGAAGGAAEGGRRRRWERRPASYCHLETGGRERQAHGDSRVGDSTGRQETDARGQARLISELEDEMSWQADVNRKGRIRTTD